MKMKMLLKEYNKCIFLSTTYSCLYNDLNDIQNKKMDSDEGNK